jgi:putative transposase
MSDQGRLEFGNYYHIFNRGINRENIFLEESNYQYFLELIKRHILGIADLYAYCLLKNHFHLLVRIKSEDEIAHDLGSNWSILDRPQPSQKFSNLFNAYSKAFNKRYNRTGGLFQRPFRRIRISTNKQLLHLIHRNPEKHSLIDDFRDWPYTSYKDILSGEKLIDYEEVIRWFGTVSEFENAHKADVVVEKFSQ